VPTYLRIALAAAAYPQSPEHSVALACEAIHAASAAGARIVCLPECYIPGYPRPGMPARIMSEAWLDAAMQSVQRAAQEAGIAAIVGTERIEGGSRLLTAMAVDSGGNLLGYQDKVQLDPSEEVLYVPGTGRHVFAIDGLRFGIVICHEGFRYPETVRTLVRAGAQAVFHPHYSWDEGGCFPPDSYAHPANSFHESAALCRAAENSCYYATVNCAEANSPTTTALINPDGTLHTCLPRGVKDLLVADIDTDQATGYLASRLSPNG
jgi:predicted amidohydrolase